MRGTELVGTAEAAVFLNLSQARVCQLCKSGELPAIRVGFVWVIDGQDLLEYKINRPKYSRR